MITTLTSRELTGTNIKFSFIDKTLRIVIQTAEPHKVFGQVNITLSNASIITAYKLDRTLIDDLFNQTFKFTAISAVELESIIPLLSGVSQTVELVLIPTSSAVVANIDNLSVDIPRGIYTFRLINSVDSVFASGDLIAIQELSIASVGGTLFDGKIDYFDENGDNQASINGQELTFDYNAKVTVDNAVPSPLTNIAMVIS